MILGDSLILKDAVRQIRPGPDIRAQSGVACGRIAGWWEEGVMSLRLLLTLFPAAAAVLAGQTVSTEILGLVIDPTGAASKLQKAASRKAAKNAKGSFTSFATLREMNFSTDL